jgi:hypothetical protein
MRRLRFGFSASVETTADGENARIHEIKQKRGQPPKADPFSLVSHPPGLEPEMLNRGVFFLDEVFQRVDERWQIVGYRIPDAIKIDIIIGMDQPVPHGDDDRPGNFGN